MEKLKQVNFRVTTEQESVIDKAKIMIEVIDKKSYNKKEALLRIHEKFLEDHSISKTRQRLS